MGKVDSYVRSKAPRRLRRHRKVRPRFTVAVLAVGLVVAGIYAGTGVAAATVAWKVVASPNIVGQNNTLADISCTDATDCLAVGHSAGSNFQTLIESWNGSAWSIMPSPDTSPTADNLLWGVSCTSPTACTAVGSAEVGADYDTLIESWNGTVWSIVPSPSLTSPYAELSGLSCSSQTDCTAVGFEDTNGEQTLIESWNGTTWSIVPSPNPSSIPGLSGDALGAVSCTTSTSCVAVGGNNTISSHFFQTLIESWDGSTWSVVPSPNGSGSASGLDGVSCLNPGDCTAVGGSQGGTLVEGWNGTAWSVVSSPNRGDPGSNSLSNVSCVGPLRCTAVGTSGNRDFKTLVESMSGTPPRFSGPAPGQVTCSLTAKVSFSPSLTNGGGGSTTRVNGELSNCTSTTPGLSITSGKVSGSSPGPDTGCAAFAAGDVPATFVVRWRGSYDAPDFSSAGTASFTNSIVTGTGQQEVTNNAGEVGFLVPGSGNTSSTSGSFAAAGPNGASVTAYSGQTAAQLSTLCSPTPRASKPPRPAKGIRELALTGSITLG
jgi:hypothetical protein